MNIMSQNIRTDAEQSLLDAFKTVQGKLPGCSKMQAMRSQAIAQFEQAGLPHRRVEDWKYTDLRTRMKTAYPVTAQSAQAVTSQQIQQALGPLAGLEANTMLFVNGHYQEALSDMDALGEGIEVLSLTAAFDQTPDWFASELGRVALFHDNDTITTLNTAFASDGAAIRISDKVEMDKLLHLIFVSAGEHDKLNTTRYLVSAGDDAKFTMLETHITVGDAKAQNNSVCELIVGANAKVAHIKCQLETEVNTHLSTWMVRLGERSNYRAFQMSTGAELARNQIFVRFQGEHAFANISGVFLGQNQQHNDTTLIVDHAVPNCSSQEMFKVVLSDAARGVFQGKLEVKPIAQKTDAKQMAQALLLSEQAEFDAKPELEIFADDVVCGHGATSGQIDEDLLFYLRARGISEGEAKSLLIAAFIGEVLEAVEDAPIQEALSGIAQNWLREI
ncbi:MAG: Fe-S cluster assembly protein SufD [Pseudomonadota bacterium]